MKTKLFKYQIINEVSLPRNNLDGTPHDKETCQHCQRPLRHFVEVLDRETNSTMILGRSCVFKYCGKSTKDIKNINDEETAHENNNKRLFGNLSTFAETSKKHVLTKDILEYILENQDDNFMQICKDYIEKKGYLSQNMIHWIIIKKEDSYNIDGKVKDLEVEVFHHKFTPNDFGGFHSLFGFTKDGIIKLHFSTLKTYGDKLQELKILKYDDFEGYSLDSKCNFETTIKIFVNGTFKNNKLSRIKFT